MVDSKAVIADSQRASDPLDSLFVKGDEVNRELLRDILSKFVRLDEKGRIFPLGLFYTQSNKNKVLILLLARKALYLRTGMDEAISPTELAKLSDVPEGSLRPTLRILVDERLVDDENSRYKVFSHAIQRCAGLLSEKHEDQVEPIKKGKANSTRVSMSSIIEDLIHQGAMDEGKSVREIHELVLQRRPGTVYNALYKVILDLVHAQKLTREVKGDTWIYLRPIK